MKISFTKGTAAIIAVFLIAMTIGGSLNAAVRTEHPRIWLTPELKSTLADRFNRNTENAKRLKDWCDTHLDDDLSSYVDSRAVTTLRAINHALMYQLTGNAVYGNRAIAIVRYILDHPYSGYTTDTWIEFDNFYTDRYLVPTVAIIYDWCYDLLSSDDKSVIGGQLDRWATDIINSEPWSFYDPSNNYFYGHLWALLTTGYALYGDNSDAETYIDQAKNVMLTQGIKYTKDEAIAWENMGNRTGRAKGGIWNEGTSYGCVNNEFICSAVLAVKSAEGIDYTDFTFPSEIVDFYIYGTYPGGGHAYADGDGATYGTIDATVRVPVLLATTLSSGETKMYGQYWINHYTSPTTRNYKLYNEFIWYDDTLSELNYTQNLPDYYFAEGTQVLFWREGWSANDCWMAFRIGLLNTDHAHNGLGNFIIYDKGYLATDKAAETGESMLFSDIHHNVLYIPPYEDKKLYWGASKIKHLLSTTDYLYYAGDMSDVYLAQPDYRHNTVSHKEREFFLLKGEKLLCIMDRGESFEASTDKIFQIYLHNAAVQDGSFYRSSNGSSDLLIKTAFPDNVNVTLDNYGTPRMQVTTPDQSRGKAFLHVLKVANPGERLYTADVTVNGAEIAASLIRSGSEQIDYLVAFSSNTYGASPSSDSYTLTFNRFNNLIKTYIMNCEPNTTYYISASASGSATTVVISKSTTEGAFAATSNADGLIETEINLTGEEQPVPAPNGIKID